MVMKYIEKECEGKCPDCASEDILWHTGQIQDEVYIYNAECNECGILFTEEYTLQYNVSIIQKEEHNG